MPTTPLSQLRNVSPEKGCLVFFFLMFSLLGVAGSYFALWKPLSGLLASRLWTETRCDVLSSRVEEVGDESYGVDIRYTWIFDDSRHEGSRYDFMSDSASGGREGKQRIVDRYPPGARVACWVDPNDPNEAVLSRSLSSRYLIGLLPLPFLAIGLGGLIWAFRPGRRASRRW